MSRLLLSKLSPLIHKSRSVRLFSSSKTGPYMLFDCSAKPLPEGGSIGEVVLFDPAKEKLVNFTDKTIPEEIISANGLGASKGWGIFCDPQDRCVLITEEDTTEGRFMCYTDDIGDLCIFVSKGGEAFCVPASSFPGLKPNSIYFLGFDLGIYDLTTKTASSFQAPKGALNHVLAIPHWFPPSSS